MAANVPLDPGLPNPGAANDPGSLSAYISYLVASLLNYTYKVGERLNLCLPKDGSEAMSGQLTLASYTVAGLPTGVVGSWAYASNGRKVGEGVGAGTGVMAYFSNGSWRRPSDDTVVVA